MQTFNGPELQGLAFLLLRRHTGHNETRRQLIPLCQDSEELQPAHTRQIEIDNYRIRIYAFDEPKPNLGTLGNEDLVPFTPKQLPNDIRHGSIVLDDDELQRLSGQQIGHEPLDAFYSGRVGSDK